MRKRTGASLFLVVIIVGLASLAALFVRVVLVELKAKGHRVAMKTDLAGLRAFEEKYRASYGRYASTLDTSQFRFSRDVQLVDLRLSEDGWSATIRHPGVPDVCSIEVKKSDRGAPTCR